MLVLDFISCLYKFQLIMTVLSITCIFIKYIALPVKIKSLYHLILLSVFMLAPFAGLIINFMISTDCCIDILQYFLWRDEYDKFHNVSNK